MITALILDKTDYEAQLEMVQARLVSSLDLRIDGIFIADESRSSPVESEYGIISLKNIEDVFNLPGLEMIVDLSGDNSIIEPLKKNMPSELIFMEKKLALGISGCAKELAECKETLEASQTRETALRRECDQLKNILDSLPDAVIVLDGNKKLEWGNERFKDITGRSPESLSVDGVFKDPFHLQAAAADGADSVDLVDKVRKTGRPLQFIHFEPGEDTGQNYYRVIITPYFDEHGGLIRVVETIRPITDIVLQRREIDASERQFRQFVENAHDMITIKDLEGKYLVINQPAASFLGKHPDECKGKKDRELFSSKLADLLEEADREIVQKKEYLSKHRVLSINGEVRHIDTAHFPLFDYKGAVTGVCSISRDVTEQKKLQKLLIQSEKMAAVGKLAASVAHEINNPLTGVLAFAEELKMDAAESDPYNPIIPDLDVIISETLRCRGIVSQLLDYARLEPAESRPLDINDVIRRSIDLVKKQAIFHNIILEQDLAENLPDVQYSPGQMEQVYLNLIINAAEAVYNQGRITIASSLSNDGKFVETYVQDNGPGIPDDIKESIFEPFFSTKGAGGTGQGLSAARAIVNQHGGLIEVVSEPGKGASFKVSLPAARLISREKWQ